MCSKSDPYNPAKTGIETHIKVGIGGGAFCMNYASYRGRTCVDVHIATINLLHPAGYPHAEIPIVIDFT